MKKRWRFILIKTLGGLPIHQKLQQLILKDLLWEFEGVTLYPKAMSDDIGFYPKIETIYAFTPDMNIELIQKYNKENLERGKAILKIKYYNQKKFIRSTSSS